MHLCLTRLLSDWKVFHRESKQISDRINALIELSKLASNYGKTKSWMYRKIAGTLEVSERSLYRWARNYKLYGIHGLRSRKPPGKRPKLITGWIARYIKTMRDDYRWGAEVIQAHLREDFGIEIGIWRIHNFLKKRGYIERKKRKLKKKKHFKKILIFEPGSFTQMDIKHHPRILRNGRKCYVYNFVDHASKWQFKMAFDGYGAWETYRFMQALLEVVPFKIKLLQTDHGVEFTYCFIHTVSAESTEHPLDHICKVNGIKKRLTPVGEKEANGLVERSHRMDDEELYETIRPANVQHFNRLLSKHTKWLNNCRRRKPLEWRTAHEYLRDYKVFCESTEQGQVLVADLKKAA
ncbi:MAG: hypothetical protein BroJett040_08340 [Oligoflexia bacterium]|nr:MAG: hypothetical protein BroJett040_08340 [Oligoflexia bacterium]